MLQEHRFRTLDLLSVHPQQRAKQETGYERGVVLKNTVFVCLSNESTQATEAKEGLSLRNRRGPCVSLEGVDETASVDETAQRGQLAERARR